MPRPPPRPGGGGAPKPRPAGEPRPLPRPPAGGGRPIGGGRFGSAGGPPPPDGGPRLMPSGGGGGRSGVPRRGGGGPRRAPGDIPGGGSPPERGLCGGITLPGRGIGGGGFVDGGGIGGGIAGAATGAAPRASRSTPIAAGDWARIGCSLTHDPSAANRVTPPGEVAPGAIAPGERKDAGGPRRRPRLLSGVGGGMMGVGSVCGGSIDPGGSMKRASRSPPGPTRAIALAIAAFSSSLERPPSWRRGPPKPPNEGAENLKRRRPPTALPSAVGTPPIAAAMGICCCVGVPRGRWYCEVARRGGGSPLAV